MPEAAKNYSITELEMCGLAINITSFAHLLMTVDFDAVVDHLAIMHIMKRLSSYSFNLYYIKGKDMVLSGFLSRQKTDDSNPHESIPISFNMKEVLQENYYNLGNMTESDKYLVQTRSQAKSSGVKLPEVHGIEKSLVLHVKPETQKPINPPTDKRQPIPKPRLGQGRAGIRRKSRIVLPTQMSIQTPVPIAVQSLPEPVIQSQERVQPENQVPGQTCISQPTGSTSIKQPIGPRVEHGPIAFYPDLILRPPPRPLDVTDLKDTRRDLLDLDTDRNID